MDGKGGKEMKTVKFRCANCKKKVYSKNGSLNKERRIGCPHCRYVNSVKKENGTVKVI